MSSILKALKRLETAKEAVGTSGSSTGPSFSPRHSLRRNSSFALWKKRVVLLIALASTLLGATLLILDWLGSTPQLNRSTDRRMSALPSESTAPGVSADEKAPLVDDPTPAEGPEEASAPADRDVEKQTSDASPVIEMGASPTGRNSAPDHGDGSRASSMADQAAAQGSVSLENEPSPAAADRPDPYAEARRMPGGRLKVQAIAWAPDATERMAVVNNHIVREGETLEGLFIVNIDRDAIIVRENGRLFRIFFGDP